MAESHVVTGLVEKRSELAGRIDHHRREIEQLVEEVMHLDATIKLFSPDYNLRGIRRKSYRPRNRYFQQGECQRLVLELFREADAPLSTRRIAEALLAHKGLENTSALIEQMQKNALAVVKRLESRGVVQVAGQEGSGKTWKRR